MWKLSLDVENEPPSLREDILKKKKLLFHVRGQGSFPGLIFHIPDVENEPPVLKEIPPLPIDI